MLAKSGVHAVNLISGIAGFVVFVAVVAFFVVLSVFSGLKAFGLSLSTAFDPDFSVETVEGKLWTPDSLFIKYLSENKDIEAWAPTIREGVLLNYQNKNTYAELLGVDQDYTRVIPADSTIAFGHWLQDDSAQVVVGYELAERLQLSLFYYGEPLKLLVPNKNLGNSVLHKNPFIQQAFLPVGVYQISEALDRKFVFLRLEDARTLLQTNPKEISSIAIKTATPLSNPKAFQKKLQEKAGKTLKVVSKPEMNRLLYKMLNTEQAALYLILTFVLIIALFNVVGAVVMTILDKRKHLKTLFLMGMTLRQLRRVFFFQGFLLTTMSGVSGLVVGILLTLWQQHTNFLMVPGTNLPYPVTFEWGNVLIVLLTFSILGGVASRIGSVVIRKGFLK